MHCHAVGGSLAVYSSLCMCAQQADHHVRCYLLIMQHAYMQPRHPVQLIKHHTFHFDSQSKRFTCVHLPNIQAPAQFNFRNYATSLRGPKPSIKNAILDGQHSSRYLRLEPATAPCWIHNEVINTACRSDVNCCHSRLLVCQTQIKYRP